MWMGGQALGEGERRREGRQHERDLDLLIQEGLKETLT